jgi:acyl-coenzyme A synthetase/AMP-(fatty) acid ligase
VVGAEVTGRGQVAVAFVRLLAPVTEDEWRDHCAAGIANFKVPARVVVDGPNGVKILTRDLRPMAADLVS